MEQQLKCLIIDDDTDDQEIFLMCVKQVHSGVDYLTADNGVEALDLLEANVDYVPDFIFIDVNMPKMNGIKCLQELRKIARLKETKIYMYSTSCEAAVVEQAKGYGATDFIKKPTKTSELKETLKQIFM
jgi:CheY-like chemotaxis protein